MLYYTALYCPAVYCTVHSLTNETTTSLSSPLPSRSNRRSMLLHASKRGSHHMKWSRGIHSADKEGASSSHSRGRHRTQQLKRGILQPTGQLKRGTSPKQPLTQLKAKARTSAETVAATVGHHIHTALPAPPSRRSAPSCMH